MVQQWDYKVIVERTKGLLKEGGATQGIDLGGSTKAFVFYLKRPH